MQRHILFHSVLFGAAFASCNGADDPIDSDEPTTTTTADTDTDTDSDADTDADTDTDTVEDPGTAPVAVDDALSIDEGELVVIAILDNDTDVDGDIDRAAVSVITNPVYGLMSVNPDGTLDYRHDGSDSEYDSIEYTVDDHQGNTSNVATVNIEIEVVNALPLAYDDGFNGDEGQITQLDLAGNDVDIDDGLDLASINILNQPSNGTLFLNGDGTADYTHDGTETLWDSFTYTIDDLAGQTSNEGGVALTINPINDLPVAVDDAANAIEGDITVLDLAANDYDDDDGLDLSSIDIVTPPSDGTLTVNANGTVDYAHVGGTVLPDQFTYTIQDVAGAASAEATVSITVDPP